MCNVIVGKDSNMTQIHCDRKHCLNNDKHGICTAETIEYDGRCQTYCTSQNASKQQAASGNMPTITQKNEKQR